MSPDLDGELNGSWVPWFTRPINNVSLLGEARVFTVSCFPEDFGERGSDYLLHVLEALGIEYLVTYK